MVEELLGDSFLRRLSTQFFQMLHEERPRVSPPLAEQVRAGTCVDAGWGGWGEAFLP